MKKAPLAGWKAFLASPAAPPMTMGALELEGYLTGLVVVPDLIPPSIWISGLWGEEEPVFDSDEQLQATLNSVMDHYNAIIRQIDSKGARWKPMFFMPDVGVDIVQCSQWVHGFWRAMMFAPDAWLDLAEDERTQILVQPFTVFIDLDDADQQLPPDNADAIRRENAELIPRVLPALRKLAQIRASEIDPIQPSRKAGRNEPCPCGSGKEVQTLLRPQLKPTPARCSPDGYFQGATSGQSSERMASPSMAGRLRLERMPRGLGRA